MDPPARKRLIQILGMLGSAHDGEVLNAARLAQRALGAANTTWAELLDDTPRHTEADLQRVFDEGFRQGADFAKKDAARRYSGGNQPATWLGLAREMLKCENDLTDWERGFLESYSAKGWSDPTPKQQKVLERIATKLGMQTPWKDVG